MSLTVYKLWKYKTTFTKATHRHGKCEKFKLRVTRKTRAKNYFCYILYTFEHVLHKILCYVDRASRYSSC